ncbi:MAG: leucine-rich repeat domain-containing protein [Bacteroidales bacterium]|nr:leucine-rich repeat domain-containing protein [Bacteroidales bacterium]
METKKQFFFMRAAMSLLVMLCSLGAWADEPKVTLSHAGEVEVLVGEDLTITATADGFTCNIANVTYEWFINGVRDESSTDNVYKLITGEAGDYEIVCKAKYEESENATASVTCRVIVPSGYCGASGHESDVSWTLTGTSPDYTLTISGTGAMADYDGINIPWKTYNITSIVIDQGVASIGEFAFANFNNLSSITMASSVTSIGVGAFAGCSNLASVTIPSYVTSIGEFAFAECSNLTAISIPYGVSSIGVQAFHECSNLASVTIPASVTTIGVGAFNNTALTSIEIPASVTSIGPSAFEGCSALATVTVYAPSCTLGTNAFSDCNNLANIYVFSDLVDDYKADWSAYESKIKGMVGGYCGTTDHKEDVVWRYDNGTLTISGTGEMTSSTPNEQPWSNYANDIETIVIGNGVTSIGMSAFFGYTALTSVTFAPESQLKSIDDYAFYDCSGLTSIEFPASVTSIGPSAFEGCSVLTSIEIPASVTSISAGAFYNCTCLSSVTFAPGSKLESIGDVAFALNGISNGNLTSIVIPASVTSIGVSAFMFRTELTSVTFASGSKLESMREIAFALTGLTSVEIPASVTSIGTSAFNSCSNLASVKLNSNPTIGNDAFKDIKEGATVTMNLAAAEVGGAHWTTFYNNYGNFQTDENTEVYKGAVSGSELVLTAISDKIVDAGNAVILKSTGNPVMTLTATNSSDTQANDLKGLSVRTLASDVKTNYRANTIYVMGNKSNKFGFHKYTGAYMPANKAFLALGSGSPAPLRMVIDDDEETTGVASMADGIDNMSDVWYTLDGRKLNGKPTTKGLYIVNGKKVMIK